MLKMLKKNGEAKNINAISPRILSRLAFQARKILRPTNLFLALFPEFFLNWSLSAYVLQKLILPWQNTS